MSDYFAHPTALVETRRVGAGTRIWAFAHVLPGAVIGRDCNVCDHVFVENDVQIGDRVTVKCGVQLWDGGVRLEDDVFVGPNATFTNDPFPRSRRRPERFALTTVRQGASVGANATILPGLTIGPRSMVGAGAVVTFDVPAHAIVAGNPAQVQGYVDSAPAARGVRLRPSDLEADVCRLKGARLVAPADGGGRARVGPPRAGARLPAWPSRRSASSCRSPRGASSSSTTCPAGRSAGSTHTGSRSKSWCASRDRAPWPSTTARSARSSRLDSPARAVHLQPLVWAVQYRFTPDAVLAVVASGDYDPGEYFRDYDEFLSFARERLGHCTSPVEE